MLRKTSLNILHIRRASVALAAIVGLLGIPSAFAASADQRRLGKPVPHHHHLYAMYRGPAYAPPAALPYAPEYGFLRQVPPNAIRGPRYTFVPGVGILGESCDLPTSACSNEYRDIQ
jgi:hypothetical protein